MDAPVTSHDVRGPTHVRPRTVAWVSTGVHHGLGDEGPCGSMNRPIRESWNVRDPGTYRGLGLDTGARKKERVPPYDLVEP